MVTVKPLHILGNAFFVGMLGFCLISIEPVTYSVELKRLSCSKQETLSFIKGQVSKGCIPELNSRYCQQQAGTWFRVFQAGKASLKLSPLERPSSKILQDILHCSLIYESMNPIRYLYIMEQHWNDFKKTTQVKLVEIFQ